MNAPLKTDGSGVTMDLVTSKTEANQEPSYRRKNKGSDQKSLLYLLAYPGEKKQVVWLEHL
jgi:hypothetical protein